MHQHLNNLGPILRQEGKSGPRILLTFTYIETFTYIICSKVQKVH